MTKYKLDNPNTVVIDENRTVIYTISKKHRGKNKNKSSWSIAMHEEVDLFADALKKGYEEDKYPRSKNYLNHLHLLFNDRLEVYSFNHDALINQQTKRVGLEYIPDEQPSYMKSNQGYSNDNYPSDFNNQDGDFDAFNMGDIELPF